MKSKILIVIFLLLGVSISAQEQKSMIFANSEVDLGTLKMKESKDAIFRFKNSGSKPFLILEAKSSCGCTSPKYKKKPISVNEKDSVVVTFKPNSTGIFYKKVVIKNSVGENQVLVIRGSVK